MAAPEEFRALDSAFRFSGTADTLVDVCCRLFGVARATPWAEGPDSSLISIDQTRDGQFRISRNGNPEFTTGHGGVAIEQCVQLVTRSAIAASDAALLVHGAAVELADSLVLVVGPSGAGKSTLAAALLGSGGCYVTDEAFELDLDGSVRAGLCRPIQLDGRSRKFLGLDSLHPDLHTPDGSSYFPPPINSCTRPVASRTVFVFLGPKDGPLDLCQDERAAAVVSVISNSFEPSRSLQSGLDAAVSLVRSAEIVKIRGGSPQERVDALRSYIA